MGSSLRTSLHTNRQATISLPLVTMVGLLKAINMKEKERLNTCKRLAEKLAYEFLCRATEEEKVKFFESKGLNRK